MKNYFTELKEYISNKSVLCVPIISSIDRKTGEYKLDADGNVNRIITTFYNCDSYKTLILVLPKKCKLGSDILLYEWVKMKSTPKKPIHIIWCDNFGIHAGEQRSNIFVIDDILKTIEKNVNMSAIDLYILESQGLIMRMIDKYKEQQIVNKIVFWNYTCTTFNKTRSFLNGYQDINENLFLLCRKTIMASPEQCQYFNKVEGTIKDRLMYIPVFMDRNIPVFKYSKNTVLDQRLKRYAQVDQLFYLPYRLTDEGYNLDLVIDYINKDIHNRKTIIYGDPNNSGYMDKIKDKFVDCYFMKVSTSRDTYYTILDCDANIIIPYFEDIAYINHASLQEFMDDRCKCKIVLKQYDTENPYDIESNSRVEVLK